MADMNQNKAEQYRQERKERLAKSAKKNAKGMEKSIALRAVVKKVIAIVLVAVIALGAAYGILDYAGVVNKAVQVGYVGNENISFSEYIYYYNHNRIQSKTKWMPPIIFRETSTRMCYN